MDVSTQDYEYKKLIQLTAEGIPTFAPLHKFLREAKDNLHCKITLVEFQEDNHHHHHHQKQDNLKDNERNKKDKRTEPREIEPCDLKN